MWIAGVVGLASVNPALAAPLVYDSLSAGTSSSWLNAMDWNGTLVSLSDASEPVASGKFRTVNNLLTTWSSEITVGLYTDLAGVPGSLLGGGSASFAIAGQASSDIEVALGDILLPAGPFWVTWQFLVEENASGIALGGTTTIGSNSDLWARNTGSGWSTQPFGGLGQPGIQLIAVPEPVTALLLALGLMALAAGRQRRAILKR
jgi:hypothetical protein